MLLTAGQEAANLQRVGQPSYNRLAVDERRERLLELGAKLFAQYSYGDLSMATIAREAGISKGLLYHYFDSKSDYFQATLQEAAEDLARRTEPDSALAPIEQLVTSLEAYLGWIEEHSAAYARLLESTATLPEVRQIVDGVRQRTAERVLAGLVDDEPPAKARAAVHGWLYFMDGVCLEWIERRDMERDDVRDLLVGTLGGALVAAGVAPPQQ